MKREDKIKQVTNISKFLTINKIPNTITQEGDDSSIIIYFEDINVDKGINHIILRHVVNTTNFESLSFGWRPYDDKNVVEFKFDVSEDTNPFEEKK